MDVVALAQHGVGYAVATLGTATTAVHVQKLLRQTDSVVFCFDGDAAGRSAAWRALETRCRARRRQERQLPVPARGRGSRQLRAQARPCGVRAGGQARGAAVRVPVRELSSRHPPASVEGRAALVAAARPFLAQIEAPVLHALLRRRLAELSGLPESDLKALLGPRGGGPLAGSSAPAARPRRGPARRGPSLARELMQMLLLQPELARSVSLPPMEDGGAEEAALAALVDHVAASEGPLTTASVLQWFADTPHDAVLSAALAMAQDHGLTPDLAEAQLREGVERWWITARREGRAGPPNDQAPPPTPEEAERLRQLDFGPARRSGPVNPLRACPRRR